MIEESLKAQVASHRWNASRERLAVRLRKIYKYGSEPMIQRQVDEIIRKHIAGVIQTTWDDSFKE